MQYIKHYYVDEQGGSFCCTKQEPRYKRHPVYEYPGLDVKVWLQDSDGVDVMLAQVPDTTLVSDIIDEDCGKKAVQVLTLAQFESVHVPYTESAVLYGQALTARQEGDEDTAAIKESESESKLQEAVVALHAL